MLACLIHALRLQLDDMRASLRIDEDSVNPLDFSSDARVDGR